MNKLFAKYYNPVPLQDVSCYHITETIWPEIVCYCNLHLTLLPVKTEYSAFVKMAQPQTWCKGCKEAWQTAGLESDDTPPPGVGKGARDDE